MPSYTSGQVMDLAASYLNDAPKSLYTYTVQLPFLKTAVEELDQEFNLNEIETNLISEAVIPVLAGAISLSLPSSFFLPISLMERKTGETNFVDMVEHDNVYDLKLTAVESLLYWDYRHNCINFIGSTTDRDVRLYYYRTLTPPSDEFADVALKGAKVALAYKTAAGLAEAIPKNMVIADRMEVKGERAIDRLLSLYVKNDQSNRVRRKPFRRPTIASLLAR